jgi:hypothetical protein
MLQVKQLHRASPVLFALPTVITSPSLAGSALAQGR